jgi:hypothetical protein
MTNKWRQDNKQNGTADCKRKTSNGKANTGILSYAQNDKRWRWTDPLAAEDAGEDGVYVG